MIATLVLTIACHSVGEQGAEETRAAGSSGQHSDEPAADAEVTTPGVNDELADSIRNYLTSEYLTEGDQRAIADDQRKFQLHQIDLNGDGQSEVFINFITSYFCGTGGCTLLLLSHDRELITEFTVTRPPLWAEPTTKNGWRVLLVRSEGALKKLVYQDGTYPSNPSVVEETADEPSAQAEQIFGEEGGDTKTYDF